MTAHTNDLTEIDRILQEFEAFCRGEYQGIADYDRATALQALQSVIRQARIDEIRGATIAIAGSMVSLPTDIYVQLQDQLRSYRDKREAELTKGDKD